MPNAWVNHIKRFAADNNISYACALSDPRCAASYRQPKPPARPPSPAKVILVRPKYTPLPPIPTTKSVKVAKFRKPRGLTKRQVADLIIKDKPNWRAIEKVEQELEAVRQGRYRPRRYFTPSGKIIEEKDERPIEVRQKEEELLNKLREEFERNERMRKNKIITSSDPNIWDKNAKLYAGMGKRRFRPK